MGARSSREVAPYPLHESEKGIPDREEDPPQSLNEYKMDANSDNVLDHAGQSSKVGGNEEGYEKCLKDSEEALHNTDEDLSKAITLDCGLFVATYAEYLSDRHQIPSSDFDQEMHRTRYASLLWDYGVNKA
ncbi:hypothetical protein CQW23_24150 [Capsicum baccatum]|uniref:Ubiquitin-like protease family profile domain-containing protein n=1 Tax=Capsicum baccatum TaxID=33114 RepID=A0A2G2VTY5_CAPBA|nr:hypothetical protein CQW23_24150 [Capsicum baccatum]